MIERPGKTPYFYEYPTNFALVRSIDNLDSAIKNFNPQPIAIPSYQRRIVWDKEQIRDFIDSDAVLFGTVILATETNEKPLTLLDGLQRFATSTALLHRLYDVVLSEKPLRKDLQHHFEQLKLRVQHMQPIFQHNHNAMLHYVRKGIQESYEHLYANVEYIIADSIEEGADVEKFARNITKTFLDKQIAIDQYYNFTSKNELIYTFININSTGMNLSEVDLLRSIIIEQAEKLEWSIDDIDEMENDFTRVFHSKKYPGADKLAVHMYKAIKNNGAFNGHEAVFPDWKTLNKDNVDHLLHFIDTFYTVLKKSKESLENTSKDVDTSKKSLESEQKEHPYLYEISQCGSLPTALTLWYLYKYVYPTISNSERDETNSETGETNSETDEIALSNFLCDINNLEDQNLLLRAFYRRIIDSTIGRIGSIFTDFILENGPNPITSIPQLARSVAEPINSGRLNESPNRTWLEAHLIKIGRDARRVFNACLLPNRDDVDKSNFIPKIYGNSNQHWNIDHMIPKAVASPRDNNVHELEMIHNFAPLPAPYNKLVKDISCKDKLELDLSREGKGLNLYSKVQDQHPYLKWLTTDHYEKYEKFSQDGESHPLNIDTNLLPGAECQIGHERITKLCELLQDKI